MCKRIRCEQCQRPTYAGCGMHIEQVLGEVPPAERCQCRERARTDDSAAQKPKKTSFWRF